MTPAKAALRFAREIRRLDAENADRLKKLPADRRRELGEIYQALKELVPLLNRVQARFKLVPKFTVDRPISANAICLTWGNQELLFEARMDDIYMRETGRSFCLMSRQGREKTADAVIRHAIVWVERVM